MEGFYDKEAGIAWGPITKEEMLDDLLIYGPKNITRRNTLGCITDISTRSDNSNVVNKKTHAEETSQVIILSSDEEDSADHHYLTKNSFTLSDSSHDDGCYSSEIQQLHEASQKNINIDMDNIKDNNLDIKDRLPTPANLDEDTYDEIFEYTNDENSSDDNDDSLSPELTKDTLNLHEDILYPEHMKDMSNFHERINLYQQDVNEDRLSPQCIKYTSNFHERINLSQQDVNEDRVSPEHIKDTSNFHERINLYQQDVNEDRISPDHITDASNFHEIINLDQQDINEDRISPEHITDTSNFHERINLDQQHVNEDRVSPKHTKDSSTFHQRINLDKQESPKLYTRSVSEATASVSSVGEDVFNDTLAEMERLLNQQELNDSFNVDYNKIDTENLYIQHKPSNTSSICGEEIKTKTEEFVYESCEDVIDNNTYNIFSTEKPRLSSSISGEAPSPIVEPKIIITGTKPKSTIKSALPVYNRKAALNKVTPNRNVKSPISSESAYINNQNVKSALTPTNSKQQFLHPALKTASSSKKRYQNIESPVSIYIKNSGSTPLFKTVLPAKPLSCEKGKFNTPRSSRKENSITFPEVIYKPAKHAIVTTAKVLKMPNNIDCLIPHKPNITKHVGRLGLGSKEKMSERLLEDDLTVNDSVSTIEDTSIHYTKGAYIS